MRQICLSAFILIYFSLAHLWREKMHLSSCLLGSRCSPLPVAPLRLTSTYLLCLKSHLEPIHLAPFRALFNPLSLGARDMGFPGYLVWRCSAGLPAAGRSWSRGRVGVRCEGCAPTSPPFQSSNVTSVIQQEEQSPFLPSR